MFQSSPGFGAGRYKVSAPQVAPKKRFNPRPALGPGATRQIAGMMGVVGKFQSSPGFGAGRYRGSSAARRCGISFQSSPGFGAGRYTVIFPERLARTSCFNPRPALGPGATSLDKTMQATIQVSILARLWGRALQPAAARRASGSLSFNPRPALGPGATD